MNTSKKTALRLATVRFATALGFMSILFSVNFLVNGTCELLKPVARKPAMMRLTPIVRKPISIVSIAEIGRRVLEKAAVNFNLATRAYDFSKGTDGRRVAAVQQLKRDYSMIIPARLSPVSDVGGISMQVIDHSVTEFFNQASIKNSAIGRAAHTVEEKMNAEVELGGDEPESVKHNLKFQVKASQSKASMEYRGLTNCDLSYSVAARQTNLEIFESFGENSKLVFTHSDAPSDRRDVLSLRMHW